MMNRTIKNVIDTRLANIKISDELKGKILSNSYKKRKTVKRVFAIAAAILCVMLSVSVMAATIPNFNKLLYTVSPQIAQFLQPIGVTSEDNGIKMEVVAAMSDDDTAVVYISMQDLTADRVDEDIDFYNYSITGLHSFTSQVISYDKASRTAIVRLLANGGSRLNGKKVTVNVNSFLSDKQSYNLFDTGIDLVKAVNDSNTSTIPLDMHNIPGGSGDLFNKLIEKGTINILKTDEMNIALPNINFAHISNIGIIDGQLHVQTKWNGNGIDDHGTFALIDSSGNRINPSNIYFGTDEKGNTKYGSEYVEYIFQVKKTELNNYRLNADHFTTSGQYTEGKWQTTFKIEAVEKSTVVDCDMNSGGIKINKVSVSPIGVSIIGNGNIKDNTNDISVSVKMNDGSILALKSVISQREDDMIICKYMPTEPIKVANVKEININGKVVRLK